MADGCSLRSPRASAVTMASGGTCWIELWEPAFTFGGQKSLMAVTFLVYWVGSREFHFTIPIDSVQFSHSVMSDSLWPHELQHARPPCPSPTPGVYPNSRASSQWCHPAISSSVIPFSSCPQSLAASESFPMISNTLLLHAHPPLVPGNCYSILYSMSLTVFDTSWKGIHVVLVRLFLAYFSWHNVFQVRSCCLIGQGFLFFKE